MKNTMHKMKRILAALLAAACLPVAGVTARADVDWYWGIATNDQFDELVPINNYDWDGGGMVFLQHPDSDFPMLITAEPRENSIRFYLQNGADVDAVLDVMEKYFPDIRASFDAAGSEIHGLNIYYSDQEYEFFMSKDACFLELCTEVDNKAELESGLLLDLASAHLITAFYGWSSTANYSAGYIHRYTVLDGYKKNSCDWDRLQTYLDEHHPGCQVEQYEYHSESEEQLYEEGTVLYRIHTPDTMSFKDRFELACELYKTYGLRFEVTFMDSAGGGTLLGHNALENKGDVTLDLELDIMDVIAANKAILGSYSLCDTARKNADISGDGTPDETDSLAILKEVVGITEGFVEP